MVDVPSLQNINIVGSEPTLRDLQNLHKREIKLEMNCMHIGTIQSFNATLQTATATINYTQTYNKFNKTNNTQVTTANYPILVDCPVFTLQGGLGYVSMPIQTGDTCLVFFNDRDMDNWWATGNTGGAPNTTRLHSFADAIIMVGINPQVTPILDWPTDKARIYYAGNTIDISEDKIEISLAGGTTTLTLSNTGKLAIENVTGEFVSNLYNMMNSFASMLTQTMLGPEPLMLSGTPLASNPDWVQFLAILQSFKS